MFGFGKVQQVVPLSIHDGLLTFASPEKYKVGKSMKVMITVVYSGKMSTPTVPLTVVAVEPSSDQTFQVTGLVQLQGRKLQELMAHLTYGGIKGADRRRSRRLACTVRILSRELPSFRAVTLNVNLTGAELRTEGIVTVGHPMNLQFDLESVGISEFTLPATCIWSRESVDDARRLEYRTGVALVDLTTKQKASWDKFYHKILSIEGASVMLKTMDGDTIPAGDPSLGLDKDPQTSLPSSNPEVFSPPPTFSEPSPTPSSPPQSRSHPSFAPPPPPSTYQPSSNLLHPPGAAVPSPHELGGGFASQAAPPPPQLGGRLQLPKDQPIIRQPSSPAPPSEPRVSLNLPNVGPSHALPPKGNFPLPPSQPPSISPGSASPYTPHPHAGGFQLPSIPSSLGQSGVNPAFSPATPPSQPNFQLPQLPLSPQLSESTAPSSAIGGFQLPLPPGHSSTPLASPSFQIPPSTHSHVPDTAPKSVQPTPERELVHPLSIQGERLHYRCRIDSSNTPGLQKTIDINLEAGGQTSKVPIRVTLQEVQTMLDGSCTVIATILEDARKIQVLNQLIKPTD